jgi:hypothetical protein
MFPAGREGIIINAPLQIPSFPSLSIQHSFQVLYSKIQRKNAMRTLLSRWLSLFRMHNDLSPFFKYNDEEKYVEEICRRNMALEWKIVHSARNDNVRNA